MFAFLYNFAGVSPFSFRFRSRVWAKPPGFLFFLIYSAASSDTERRRRSFFTASKLLPVLYVADKLENSASKLLSVPDSDKLKDAE
jgi:hypothetical protein